MNYLKTIEILESLASGCSPETGEEFGQGHVLHERNVIRALQFALIEVRKNAASQFIEVDIPNENIEHAKDLFKENQVNSTPNKLIGFFLGEKKFKEEAVMNSPLYGRYKGLYTQGQLMDYLKNYFEKESVPKERKRSPLDDIDFFDGEGFNNLSSKAIEQLKAKVAELGVQKTEDLAEHVVKARIQYPRAYESWSEDEDDLLTKAMEFTNDVELLSDCFQRGFGSIVHRGKYLLYEAQKAEELS